MGGQGSLMHLGSKDWPKWSDPTDLLLKLLKKLMLDHRLLAMGLYSCRAVRMPVLTPVHF